MTRHRLTKVTLTAICIGALGACSQGDSNADTLAARSDSAGRADSAAGRLDSNATTTNNANNPNANASWSNDRVFGFAHSADSSEIALGRLAQTRGTNAQVKAFGRQMVTDHQAMMKTHHALMTKLNAKVDTTAGDARDLMTSGQEQLKELTEKERGVEWDRAFINNQISTHEKVLEKLQDAAKNSTDTSLTAALPKAAAKVQEHLTKAQSIKQALE